MCATGRPYHKVGVGQISKVSPTRMQTDTQSNDWVTTEDLQGLSPVKLNTLPLYNTVPYNMIPYNTVQRWIPKMYRLY